MAHALVGEVDFVEGRSMDGLNIGRSQAIGFDGGLREG